jgi:hypothetical protein
MTAQPETLMNTTQISSKLAALAVALMMNSLLIGGVVYLFNAQAHQHLTFASLVQAAAPTSTGAV